MEFLKAQFADRLTEIACKQVKASFDYKRERMAQITKNEEFYFGRKIKVPKGQFGVPLPVMSGFVDTLMSKIDDPPVVKFSHGDDLADLKLANKCSRAITKEGASTRGNWAMKDRWSKKLACFSGRAIAKYFAESDPKYKHYWEIVDHEDFECEPAGGGYLENHLFCGQQNIFRTKAEMIRNAKAGLYDMKQVSKLIDSTGKSEFKKNTDLFQKKAERLKRLGLNIMNNTYVGQGIFRFTEWAMDYEGKRYYLLFDYLTKMWVRAHVLKQVFESELYPWHSWATHEHPFIFWSKAPCDDVLPVADAMDTLFNQALTNRHKRNMNQRAYDPDMFPDPSELEWRPDGLARAKPEPGKPISSGIYEFKTPEISGTIDLVAFMDGFIGRKTGITPESPGAPEKDQKVGIYFGGLQQVADRLGLYNKSYSQFWEELGMRAAWGYKEHLSEKELIDMIGEDGIGWEQEKKKAPFLDLTITGGAAELMANEAKAKKRENALAMILKRPDLSARLNQDWLLSELLRHAAFDDPEIKVALSREEFGTVEILAEASQAIQDIVDGKEVKINRGANTAFVQKIIDYAMDQEVDDATFKKLTAYAEAHLPIAYENMMRKATLMKMGIGRPQVPEKKPGIKIGEETMVEEPVAGTHGGTLSKSLEATNILQGKSPEPAV